MKITRTICGLVAILVLAAGAANAAPPAACPDGVQATASKPLGEASTPTAKSCSVGTSHGFPIPDPKCTPGAVNPTVSLSVLQDPKFRTGCERDQASTAHQKAGTYSWYGIAHPAKNVGANQTCELDHLVSLELGGADTLDNLWPQCGPAGVTLNARYFKQKDQVENYLAAMVRAGKIELDAAQHGIATNWTQYLDDAKAWSKAK
jgi:hypothetical protein